MQLYNKLSAEVKRELKREARKERLTISFYQYHQLGNPRLFRDYLFLHWYPIDVLGRIYAAHEGITAQLSVSEDCFEAFKTFLDSIDFFIWRTP